MPGDNMGRTRQKNKDLAPYPGLRRQRKGQKDYYLLEHDKLSKTHSLGSDKAKAIAAYNVIMEHLTGAEVSHILPESSTAPRMSLGEVIDRFKAGHQQRWAESTRKEKFIRLDRIRSQYGRIPFLQIDILKAKQIIYSFQGDGRRQTKVLLSTLWDYAIGEGYSDRYMANIPSKVNLPPRQERQRERIMTMEDYRAARAKCPEWLQDAADLALITLQGRMEIVTARINKHIVKRGESRFLQFQRQKTLNTTAHAVEIEIGENLAPIIHRCMERSMRLGACPFLLSVKQRSTNKSREAKQHRAQVLPEYLTRAWTRYTGYSFHEIRSLGRRVYEQQLIQSGYTAEQTKHYICSLTGWADEKMYKLYSETNEVTYLPAKAELSV